MAMVRLYHHAFNYPNFFAIDVHKGIYAIFAHNLTTGSTQTLVDSAPGGASRPELSRDGRSLAFVRRVRDKEALVIKWVFPLVLLEAMLNHL